VLKRKGAPEEPVQPKRKVGGTSRVPKRLKVELQNNGGGGETAQKQAPKGLVFEMFINLQLLIYLSSVGDRSLF
jgi:hypothetical protein